MSRGSAIRLALLALLWGSSFLFIKVALEGLSPIQIVLARMVAGALVLLAIVAAQHDRLPRDRRMWAHIAVASIIANLIPYFLFGWGEQHVDSSVAGALNATTPLFTLALAFATHTETTITRERVVGFVLGFLGAVLIVAPWNSSGNSTSGALACLAAALSYGVSYVYMRRFLTGRGTSPIALAAAQISVGALILIVAAPALADQAVNLQFDVVASVVALGALGTGLAYLLNYRLIDDEGATTASTVTYLLPIVAVVLGALVLGEAVTWNLFVGTLIVLSGVAVAQLGNEAGTSRLARRRAVRRWRLWWRFQFRRLPSRQSLRRLRLVSEASPDVVMSRTQLRMGRLLGRAYLATETLKERGRIEKSQLPSRTEPLTTTAAVVARQRALLIALVVLIGVGLGLDALVRAVGPDLAQRLGIENWLRQTFTLPSDDTLRNLLAAAAGGTATILGLVLSISLIVWQATADRYRSSSIASFLLRERVGSAIVRLLALGFTYSLWVLAVLEVFGATPYVSSLIAVVITTGAVLSLLGYREAGLLGYLPTNIARSLRIEISRAQQRAQRRGAGRSIEDYGRRVAAGDLQIFEDLLERLISERSHNDTAVIIEELDRTLRTYLWTKSRFRRESLFFDRRAERVAGDIEDHIVGEGLMNPVTQVPDHDWFERRLLAVVSIDRLPLDNDGVAERLIMLWSAALQVAVRRELWAMVEMLLDIVVPLGRDERFRRHMPLSEGYLGVAWVLVDLAGSYEPTPALRIVEAKPWEDSDDPLPLSWEAQNQAHDIGDRIRREVAVTGQVVTPRARIVQEVDDRLREADKGHRHELATAALTMCQTHLREVTTNHAKDLVEPALIGAAARMSLRVILRMAHHRIPVGDLAELPRDVVRAYDVALEDDAEDLRKDSARAARALAESQQWDAAESLAETNAVITSLAIVGMTDALRSLALRFDSLLTIGIVYGWAELHGNFRLGPSLGRLVEPPFAGLDGIASLLHDHALVNFALPNIEHYQWFQPLRSAMFDLPDRYGASGWDGFGFSERDHPSTLFQTDGLLFGPETPLEHLVDAQIERRAELRRTLVLLLSRISEANS